MPRDERLQIDAIYQAADADSLVGGDWYDAVHLGDGRFLFSVGDVTGHGIVAASVAARLRHAILDYALEHDDPADVIRRANMVLRREHDGTYATALVALVDVDRLQLTYASAGHPPPLLATKPDLPALELPAGGLTLGVADDCAASSVRVPLLPGAVLALYTDGIVEFDRDAARAEQLLRCAVSEAIATPESARPAAAIREAVLRGAATTDDAALVIVRVLAHAPTTADGTGHWRFDSRDADAARRCRGGLVEALRALTDDPDTLFSAELLLGEALANAVRHAPGIVDVRLDRTGQRPVLTVTDAGHTHRTCEPREVDVLRESGRGLMLIDALSDGFEMKHLSGMGTEVRIVLPVTTNGKPH
jgi:anti-sigma regulatory factor (Ser/Thr protein kinase)